MRVGEYDAVGARQAGEIVAAFGELVGALAIGRPVFRHRLVERHQRTAARVREQHDLGDAGLPAQDLDASLHVERQLLEFDQRLVVLVARVHAQHQEAAPRQLGAGAMGEIVRRAMHDQHAHMRRWSRVGVVERSLGSARNRDQLGPALRPGGSRSQSDHDRRGDGGMQPKIPSHPFSPLPAREAWTGRCRMARPAVARAAEMN